MILSIILLILITLLVSLLIMFSYYILLPSINIEEKNNDDPLIPNKTKIFLIPDYKLHEKSEFRALVMCSCNKDTVLKRTNFNENYSCFMIINKYGTGIDCKYACIGLGDCAKVCTQNAIVIKNKTAVITNNCIGKNLGFTAYELEQKKKIESAKPTKMPDLDSTVGQISENNTPIKEDESDDLDFNL